MRHLEHLKVALAITVDRNPDKENVWYHRFAAFKERRRVYGDESDIAAFAKRQGLKRLDAALR